MFVLTVCHLAVQLNASESLSKRNPCAGTIPSATSATNYTAYVCKDGYIFSAEHLLQSMQAKVSRDPLQAHSYLKAVWFSEQRVSNSVLVFLVFALAKRRSS